VNVYEGELGQKETKDEYASSGYLDVGQRTQ
jgi:hypothetical protein